MRWTKTVNDNDRVAEHSVMIEKLSLLFAYNINVTLRSKLTKLVNKDEKPLAPLVAVRQKCISSSWKTVKNQTPAVLYSKSKDITSRER